jgi:alkanesulfonate monooxygenase SsuD/methylene tetrahydromethanopterin reductase-like flavin-dependent oxidoreductase (luciferase family)
MIRLVGRLADGWIPSLLRLPLDEVPRRQAMIDEAARAAGRAPERIRRVANLNGRITSGAQEGWLRGPTAHWTEELVRLVRELRFDGFVLWPDDEDVLGQTERFASEVVPRVREALAQAG